ncbi:hypothetical protein ColLi_08211 [Colletotrichum liriopes]|uniref:Uncharacterized protein n=1 Tax=Colletotrichum liriopes TaxID=708192 RepID=A0AA37GSI5_9PEZI|nr:hypothetical protein ColLi_08211 [Colletotrichum liriopes]
MDVAGDTFRSVLASISSQVETGILPLATAWADTPDPAKATAAVQAIETLLPAIGEVANGLPDGQKIFDCPAIAAPGKRQNAQEVTRLLQKINCELLKILGGLETGQSSTDPAVVGSAQEGVRAGGDTIKSDWSALDGIIGGTTPSPQICAAVGECKLPECTEAGKTVACHQGKCVCNEGTTGTPPQTTCSADAECASMIDCEGAGKQQVCHEGKCLCKTSASPLVCSADADCASLPDCEGVGKKMACQGAGCVCKTEREAIVITTVTALPSGASIETITAQVTENMVTTTTSSGSDDPTIVPIIVSIGKPPVICWGCVLFPANIQLKLPEFCVQILGFEIGNCPKDNNVNENDNEDENDNKNKKTTTKASCSTTVTATYANVFCTVTRDPGQPETRKRDEGCSTLEYETKTACESITGATTTTATTVKPGATTCSPGTCGGSACPVGKRELANRAPPAPMRQPNAYSWFGPEHYTNKFEFMRGEVYKAYQDPSASVNLQIGGIGEISTGKWATFGDDLKTVAVAGLWGCTSVIAVSKRGVWVSHFWESRTDLVLSTLGDFTDGLPDFIDEGLGMFRGKAGPNGNMFDDDAEPQVFIVTRKERPTDMFLQGAPGDVALLALIRAELDVWWRRGSNGGPQREMTYDPIIPEGHASNDPRYPGDPEFFLFRGKAMVQYQPAIVCGGSSSTKVSREAGYRVWVEAEKLEDGEKNWKPSGNGQVRTLSKRQESCPVDGNPGGDNLGDPDGEEGEDDGTTPPPKKTCSSNANCSGPECTGGMSQYLCEEGFCVCKVPEDPSICITAKTCGYLDCSSGQDKACADGSCKCVEKTCSNVDACGLLSCSDTQEKACTDGRCRCKDKPAPAFISGLCNTHIRIYGSEKRFAASVIAYDGSGAELHRNPDLNTEHSWGEIITLDTGKLPYLLKYEFLDKWLGSTKKRDRPPPGSTRPNPLRYQTYSVRITAGDTVWSTMDEDNARQMVPRCEVGNWDTHGTWDPSEIFTDFIDAILGQGGKVPETQERHKLRETPEVTYQNLHIDGDPARALPKPTISSRVQVDIH